MTPPHNHKIRVHSLCALLILQVLFLYSGQASGTAVADSLRLELAASRGAHHLQLQEKLVLHYWESGNYHECYLQAVQLRDLSKKWNFPVLEAEGWYHMARAATRKGQEGQALQYHLEALRLRQHSNDALMLMKSYHNIGVLFHKKEAYQQAKENYTLALGLARMRDQTDVIPTILRNLGLVSKELRFFRLAQGYYEEALQMVNAQGDTVKQAMLLNHIAVLKKDQGEYAEALRYYEQASELAQNTNQQQCEAYCLNNIGQVYNLKKEFGAAIPYLEQSLRMKEALGDKNQGGTLFNLGIAHYGVQEIDEAISYLSQASAAFGDFATGESIQTHRLLSQAYEKAGLIHKAAASAEKAEQLQQEHEETQQYHAAQMQEAAAALDNIKRAMDNASIRQKKAKISGMITLFSGGVALIVLISLFVRKLRRAQETTYDV